MKKDDHDDIFGTDGPQVEPTLLLRYLIQKSEEIADGNYRGFPLPFRGLGLTGLDPFPELYQEFMEITSPSEDPVNERAKKCQKLFVEALARPQDRTPKDQSDESDEDHPHHRVIATRFCWAARRDGEEMVARKDFRFMSVWMCMSYIGLCGDAEKFRDFQEKCRLYTDPEERIEQVTPILWEALRAKMRKN